MNIEDIEDGAVYRLTQDIQNPKPDRRSRDTLAQECIPKGTTFVGDVTERRLESLRTVPAWVMGVGR